MNVTYISENKNAVRHIKELPVRKLIFILLFLSPLLSLAQKKGKAKQRSRNDSLFLWTLQMMHRFDLDSSGYQGSVDLDTLYYPDKKIKAIGAFAIDRNSKKSRFKVGMWTEYYENEQLKSVGAYQMNYLLACHSASLGLEYYSFKIDRWTYYYDNGNRMATGNYDFIQVRVSTGIADQFARKPVVSETWQFYDYNGQPTSNKQNIIAELDKMNK